ncbi:MAG: hypothetical protein IT462_16160 [Planctomycetes bacterium]|nr:hypothetical protein [Planctomycetota bacterium]
MRLPSVIFIGLIAIVFGLSFGEPASAAPAPASGASQLEVNKFIDTYLDAETNDDKRAEVLVKIRIADQAMVQKKLKALAATEEKRRTRLLELAVACRVTGVLDLVKKLVDTEHEPLVLQLAVAAPDKGAAAWAFARWKALEIETPAWAFAHDAFLSHSAPLDVLTSFKDFIADETNKEEKRVKAAEVLSTQFANSDVKDGAEWVRRWSELKSVHALDAQVFDIRGTDLIMALSPDRFGEIAKVGQNLRVGEKSALEFTIPAEWSKGNCTFTVKVRWVSGSEASIWLTTESKVALASWVLKDNGNWTAKVSGDAKAPFKKAKNQIWQTWTFEVTDEGGPENRHYCDAKLDGEKVDRCASTKGAITKLGISTEGARIVIGGVEFVRREDKKTK